MNTSKNTNRKKRKFPILHFQFSIIVLMFCLMVQAQTKSKPNKEVTIQVHVTECDEPAQGAKVVIVDVDFVGDLVSGTTNSTGDCSLKAPANNNIEVQTTYKGKGQKTSYFATDENYGKQIVYVKFTGDCDDDSLPEKATIKYSYSNGDKAILTFDNYYQRYRYEFWGKSGTNEFYHAIHIYDPFTHKYYDKPCDDCEGSWSDDSNGDLKGMHENDLLGSDKELLKQGYKRRTSKKIAGKTCSAWSMDIGPLYYKWHRIKMSEASHNGDKAGFEVTEITLDASESAFRE